MSRAADRNLLFGLLALQNNFIDRDSLLDAFQRWVNDRSTPLDRVLLDRGALSPARHVLLAGLVEEHIKLHGDDPEKSLAALSSIGSVRQDLSRIADAGIQASLARVSAARRDGDSDDPLRTVSVSLGIPTSAGSRFRILRPHAKGGLGQVSVALDQELDRPIALKEIQDRHADEPASRARFIQEAEITGKLEHPGIIPVYGLGHDASGRPFYAMRFIEGDSLAEAIRAFHRDQALTQDPARREARLRELLRRFTDVCNAVAYAHSRGVLHRDLKPGNIMLGPYGETLVVDWGLAKPLGSALAGEPAAGAAAGPGSSITGGPIRLSDQSGSRSDTVAGSPIGTPAYASPEQVVGTLDRLGPATDIYGLGATLYALLTGRPPVEADDLLDVLRRVQKGEFPSPRSIDPAIPRPLEAICVKAMALKPEDRYPSARALAEDVTRWLDDEPVMAYAEPFGERARRWMRRNQRIVAGATAAALAGLIGLAAVAAVQARSNRELKVANEKTQDALTAETKAKQETQAALARSEESRQRAEAVLGFLKDDVLAAARPEGQAGGLGVDVTVRKAIDAAEPRIAERFKEQPAVEAEIRSTLGTTYVYLRAAAQAIRQYERAVELRQTRLGPDDPVTLDSRTNLGVAYQIAGRTADAIKIHEATLKLLETKLGPDHPDTLSSRNNLATAYVEAGRVDEAITLHEATLKLCKAKLGPDHPDTVTSRSNLAEAYSFAGRVDEAITLNEEALKQCETKLGPDHPDTLISRNNLALDYRKAGRTADAIRMDEGTLRLRESKLGPDHRDTLTSRNNLAESYRVTGRIDEAITLHEATLKRRETELGPDHPDTLSSRNNLALACSDAGRVDEAIKLHEATLKQQESKLGPDHPTTLISRTNLGVAYRAAGQIDEAISLLEQALQGFKAKVGPDHAYTFTAQKHLADSYAAAGQYTTAEPLLRAGLERARKQFGAADLRAAVAMAPLGLNLTQQRKWAEAESVLRECLAICEKAQPDDWTTWNARSLLGGSLTGQQKYAEAEPLLLQGYEGMKAREGTVPGQNRKRLAEAGARIIGLYEAWGKPAEAAAWKVKLGMPDLPGDVFAPAPER